MTLRRQFSLRDLGVSIPHPKTVFTASQIAERIPKHQACILVDATGRPPKQQITVGDTRWLAEVSAQAAIVVAAVSYQDMADLLAGMESIDWVVLSGIDAVAAERILQPIATLIFPFPEIP